MIRPLVVLAALAGAGAAHAQAADRYGPSATYPTAAPSAPMVLAAAAPPPLRQLSWPGKSPAPTAAAPARAAVYAMPAPARMALAVAPHAMPAGQPVPQASLAPPQPPAYARPYVGAYLGEPRAPAALPTPYAPAYPQAGAGAPPPPAAPVSTARLYSVHREYGLQPDPAPVPPQFFGPTADLSTPETPDPALLNRRNAAATRAAATAAEGVSP